VAYWAGEKERGGELCLCGLKLEGMLLFVLTFVELAQHPINRSRQDYNKTRY
jgi:hypothetical protein